MPKHILCVEDDAALRWAIAEMLQHFGYEVIEAENGLTAIVLASTNAPDLILMDIQLPGVSGFEAVSQIRKQNSHIPIIMMTGGSLDAFSERFIAMQCNDFMLKPFEMDYLHSVIGRHLD